jgi:glucose/arabinose dehydrogenase
MTTFAGRMSQSIGSVRRTAMLVAIIPISGDAQVTGSPPPAPSVPFTITPIAPFQLPWRIAFLPDGRMLVTEKVGALWLVTQTGVKTPVANLPRSEYTVRTQGYLDNNGMLGVYTSPNYATDSSIYLTYSEPGLPYGSSIALARARLQLGDGRASLEGLQVIWRDGARGIGGQAGGVVAFSPDGRFLYLALGDRNRISPPQDPDQPLGKILRLTLDGKPAPGNPNAGKVGAKTIGIIGWQQSTEQALNAPPLYAYTFPGENLTPSETWSSGHRNPMGLAFTPDGRLWGIEHGPAGGDELNLIEPGKNYGWPLVSHGMHYGGAAIPHPDTRPDLAKPVLTWSPRLAPGNLAIYNGAMFPQWQGSGLIPGLGSRSLTRITFDGKGGAARADHWVIGHEIRDVAVAPDGAVWLLINSMQGSLLRLTPTQR